MKACYTTSTNLPFLFFALAPVPPAPLIGELCLISGVVSTLSLVSSCPMALAPGDRGLNASGVCLGTDRLCCVLAAADVVVWRLLVLVDVTLFNVSLLVRCEDLMFELDDLVRWGESYEWEELLLCWGGSVWPALGSNCFHCFTRVLAVVLTTPPRFLRELTALPMWVVWRKYNYVTLSNRREVV